MRAGEAMGSKGKQREAKGSKGKQREAKGSDGKRREATGCDGGERQGQIEGMHVTSLQEAGDGEESGWANERGIVCLRGQAHNELAVDAVVDAAMAGDDRGEVVEGVGAFDAGGEEAPKRGNHLGGREGRWWGGRRSR